MFQLSMIFCYFSDVNKFKKAAEENQAEPSSITDAKEEVVESVNDV